MRMLTNKSGFTLIETATVAGLMTLVVLSTIAMTIGSLRCYDSASTRTYTDSDAVTAMQMIVTEVREAKYVNIAGGGSRLHVVLPKVTPEGHYDRHEGDTARSVQYYLSDSTGQIGRTGTWLWRAQGSDQTVLKKNVENVLFESDTSRSVKITIVTMNSAPSGTKRTELTQRVVYLRNY